MERGPFLVGITVAIVSDEAGPGSPDSNESETLAGPLFVMSNGYWAHALMAGSDSLLSQQVRASLPPDMDAALRNYQSTVITLLRNTADWLLQDHELVLLRDRRNFGMSMSGLDADNVVDLTCTYDTPCPPDQWRSGNCPAPSCR